MDPVLLIGVVYGLLFIQGIILTAAVLKNDAVRNRKRLAVLIFSYCFPLLVHAVSIVLIVYQRQMTAYISPLSYLTVLGLGPVIMYYSEQLNERRLLLHLIPAVVLTCIDFVMKGQWFNSDFRDLFVGLICWLHTLTYTALSHKALHRKGILDSNYNRQILHAAYIYITLSVIFVVFRYFDTDRTLRPAGLTILIIAKGFIGICIQVLAFKMIRNSNFVFADISIATNINESAVNREEKLVKYQTSAMQKYTADEVERRLTELMEKEQIYLQHNLTIGIVAKKIKAPVPYLSQVVNERMQCSFPDYINLHRIKTSIYLLQTSASKYTVTELGYKVGFNNKVTFLNAFKKHTGMTPTTYKNTHALKEMSGK
jgi:AraC-like DNA-binding protein